MAAVFQHESGIPGNYPGKAKRGFVKLATSGTQLDFPQFEKVGHEVDVDTTRFRTLQINVVLCCRRCALLVEKPTERREPNSAVVVPNTWTNT